MLWNAESAIHPWFLPSRRRMGFWPPTITSQPEGRFPRLLAEVLLDHADDPFYVQRFCDVRKTSNDTSPGLNFFLFDDSGQKYDGHVFQSSVASNLRGDIAAVHVRHHHIEQDEVRLELTGGGQ